MPLSVCTGGNQGLACPITHNEFEVGQTVYVLKRERDKVLSGQSVACISAEGMNKLKKDCAPLESFKDPLRRTGDCLLTLARDFEAFVISAEPAAESSENEDSEENHVQ